MGQYSHCRALFLAGGLGSRLRPITESIPKCLVPINGRPLVEFWVDRFAEAGVREILINSHHLAPQLRQYIARLNRSGRCRMRETYEPRLLGSAGTIHANRNWASCCDNVLIVYGDNLSNVNLTALLDYHVRQVRHGAGLTMMLFRTASPESCGIAQLDSEGRVTGFVEKPKHAVGNLANAGVYAVTKNTFREIADMNAFDIGFDVLPRFVGRMHGWVWNGYHRDIGTLESLRLANQEAPSVFGAEGRKKGQVGQVSFPQSSLGHQHTFPSREKSHPRKGVLTPFPAPRPALFLDRDGTLIELVHHLSDPAQVRLLPGAAEALRRMNQAGYACVVVTNQSVVGRGLINLARLHQIQAELDRQLAAHQARLDAWYFAPEVPLSSDPATVDFFDRKPGPGMLLRAAKDLSIDLKSSWMVGDTVSDLLAGRHAGCRGSILVQTGYGQTQSPDQLRFDFTASDLSVAVQFILMRDGHLSSTARYSVKAHA